MIGFVKNDAGVIEGFGFVGLERAAASAPGGCAGGCGPAATALALVVLEPLVVLLDRAYDEEDGDVMLAFLRAARDTANALQAALAAR